MDDINLAWIWPFLVIAGVVLAAVEWGAREHRAAVEPAVDDDRSTPADPARPGGDGP